MCGGREKVSQAPHRQHNIRSHEIPLFKYREISYLWQQKPGGVTFYVTGRSTNNNAASSDVTFHIFAILELFSYASREHSKKLSVLNVFSFERNFVIVWDTAINIYKQTKEYTILERVRKVECVVKVLKIVSIY